MSQEDSGGQNPTSGPSFSSDTPPTKNLVELTYQDKMNNFSRLGELSRFFALLIAAPIDYEEKDDASPTTIDTTTAIGTMNSNAAGLFNSGGLIIGLLIHAICVRFNLYQKREGTVNILYRGMKTWACAGMYAGYLLASVLPLPEHGRKLFAAFITDVTCIAFMLFAFPYWIIRRYYYNTDPKKNAEETDCRVGNEGWSKYAKTALVFGVILGQIVGAVVSYCTKAVLATSVALWGGIVGVGLFALSFVMVPLINKLTGKALKVDKDVFRNNYVRTGITFGSSLGAAIGFGIGSLLLPGIGSMMGATIGGAIGGVIGGAILGAKGHKLSAYAKRTWNDPKNRGDNPDANNSIDYCTRTCSLAFTALGALIGFLLPIPGGFMLGGAIGGTIGWFLAFPITSIARKIQPIETDKKHPSNGLPWSQRVAGGVSLGATIGSAIGAIIGLAGGPLGVIAGAILFGAIGGVVGTIISVFCNQDARRIMWAGVTGKRSIEPPAMPVEENPAGPAPAISPPSIPPPSPPPSPKSGNTYGSSIPPPFFEPRTPENDHKSLPKPPESPEELKLPASASTTPSPDTTVVTTPLVDRTPNNVSIANFSGSFVSNLKRQNTPRSVVAPDNTSCGFGMRRRSLTPTPVVVG